MKQYQITNGVLAEPIKYKKALLCFLRVGIARVKTDDINTQHAITARKRIKVAGLPFGMTIPNPSNANVIEIGNNKYVKIKANIEKFELLFFNRSNKFGILKISVSFINSPLITAFHIGFFNKYINFK